MHALSCYFEKKWEKVFKVDFYSIKGMNKQYHITTSKEVYNFEGKTIFWLKATKRFVLKIMFL